MLQFKSKSLAIEFPLGWEMSVFVLFWPSTDFMRPTQILEDNLLYSKSLI